MTIQDIFLKPVDRHIDGVIKADDERSLLNEVEEYVITDEVGKALKKLLNHYLNNSVVNGAWISGFFGSGKSHLLKMLALLFENRVIDGRRTDELFLPKITDDDVFKADLAKACSIPSKSILFNIAQKATIVNKSHSDDLLSTFIKVFDEMCGYFGKQGYIAQFERDLDNNGMLGSFKENYQTIANKSWERGRELPLIEAGNISKAYAQTTGAGDQDASRILEKYRTHYQMSIEDFANMVHEYIEKQDKNFRLNFFVDEVGQYIANNVRLMTDLQTIAESLATKCSGRAWIFVTSQQDMDSILGEMPKQAGNDFSKIQGRFKCKVNLSSANVDEVIRLRLLAKNNQGKDLLDSLYVAQQNNLKTLFDLPDGAKKYKNFKDRNHFVSSYPFIPYQFALFQAAMMNLSKHDAFVGQYQSVGERSMLEVFQDVVKRIANEDVGKLATFNLMFEGIREVIKANVRWGVTQSEQQMDDEFTKKVLKILFLVKYVKEFQATPRNLTVLLIERFDQDLVALRKRVEESLNTLEQQTYIKRNEELYEYLTDKERDIEEDIKGQDVDPQSINEQMANMFFTSALNLNKIKYEVNGQDFPFTKRLDNQTFSKEYELGIHILTESQAKESLRAMSLSKDDLVLLIPEDDLFYKENQLYLQTDTYVKQNGSNGRSAEEIAIVADKSHQNLARFDRIKRRASELLGKAQMFVAGDDVLTELSDAKMRISFGFQKLIQKAYPNLEMLGAARYDEKDIPKHLQAGKDTLMNGFLTEMSS
ncbi:MAG: BREX system P-loop protein BrxC, partial [Sphaerochaeta sp.]|nr:BREX system P-loop protein BrxC [Sphaerochaeta sp.]